MHAISDAAAKLGLETHAGRVSLDGLKGLPLPAILHWNQKHFVVLYRISKNGKKFYISDPAKGNFKCGVIEFLKGWSMTVSNNEYKGIAMFIQPSEKFGETVETGGGERRSFRFLMHYLRQYRRYFLQIFLGLLLGCLLQLVMPFLTQSIVDVGIRHEDIGFIWLVLLGELMIVTGRTATDFIFLDEATNSLDARNEREIVGNLDKFYKGRTVVVVAHRLSTVRNADNIVVIDAGKVVETGTHDALIALRGAYYNLVKNQLELGG